MSMSKEDRLKLIRERHLATRPDFGELPVTQREIEEEVGDLDTFREAELERKRSSMVLTSDEA